MIRVSELTRKDKLLCRLTQDTDTNVNGDRDATPYSDQLGIEHQPIEQLFGIVDVDFGESGTLDDNTVRKRYQQEAGFT